MKKIVYNWRRRETETVDPTFLQAIIQKGFSESFAKLLWQREIHTIEEFQRFISAEIEDLHDPFLLHDMEPAVERIQAAILEGQPILIYGDYDADGITSTAILLETLETLGADVRYVLPNRFIHGYGPNKELFAEKINEGIQLIITVDNGVAGNDAIDYANTQGVDVIVTDHHELPPVLPEAHSIIHPRHPEGAYPFGELSGAGVAFKLATALLDEVPVELLDLACIGTVADLVSMTDENRILVKLGLEVIKQGQRLGLNQLLKVSGVDVQKLDEGSIGFSIGPRLNAIGRLGDPNPAVKLMTTFDDERAKTLATHLDEKNTERKMIVAETTKEALAQIDSANAVHLIAQKDWNPGVLGIVASNVVQETNRPAIILSIQNDGTAKGSGRSIAGLDLFEMLNTMRSDFIHFGGHAAAVGLTISEENLPILQEKINRYLYEHQLDLEKGAELVIDAELSIEEATIKFVEEMKTLAPFGTDNPAPHFLFKNGAVDSVKQIGGELQHAKFSIVQAQNQLDVIGFGFGANSEALQQPEVQFVGELEINEWNGQKKVQLRLLDYQACGLQVIDRRAKFTWAQPTESKSPLYVAFQEKSRALFTKKIKGQVIAYTPALKERLNAFRELVVLDCPNDQNLVKELVQDGDFDRIYLYLYSPDEAYLNGLPSREKFTKLYQFFRKQARVDIRYKLKTIETYLGIPEKLLVFMIHVFSELGFVTIEDGILQIVAHPEAKEIETSLQYQQWKNQITSEKFLLMSDIQTIRNWLKN